MSISTNITPLYLQEAQSKVESHKDLAADYLAKNFHLLKDAFEICLVTYALHVCNHRDKDNAFQKMAEIRREGEYIYWSPEVVPPIPTEIVNTVPFLQPKTIPLVYESRAIQVCSQYIYTI